MSRIGKQPIPVPAAAKVTIDGNAVTVEAGGKKLSMICRPEVTVSINDANEIVVERKNDGRTARAMHGVTRSLIANMIEGVTNGYTKQLEIVGAGWGADVKGRKVELKLGYADVRVVNLPDGVDVAVSGTHIKVTGCDKQKVGQVAAEIRSHRKPEPYNGKGVRYSDEVVMRKQGKAFAGGGA